MLRLVASFAVIVVIATLMCMAVGYLLAWHADEAGEAASRNALRAAIETHGPVRSEQGRPDAQQLLVLESVSGLKGLSAEADGVHGDRSTLSLVDGNGRITGWLSWQPDRPATRLMLQLLPFLALTIIGVLLLGGLALWQLLRMRSHPLTGADGASAWAAEDLLTGLPNQYRLRDLLDDALRDRRTGRVVAFAHLDLDRFEEVNHSAGPLVADEVLRGVGDRLRELLPSGTAIGRLGGDRFGLVIAAADVEATVLLVEAACHAVARPFLVERHVVQVTACAGVVAAPDHGLSREQLAPRVELALHTAKKRTRGSVVLFAPEMEDDLQERHFIERELAEALSARALDLHYQPIVAADGSGIVGVEALLRWNHPLRGDIPPSRFVPVAERCGLMGRLGQFVLRRALADTAQWPDLYVAVNLSPLQVRDRTFVDVVATLIAETRFDPGRLVLEITEGVLIENPDETKERLEELRALGVRLALDDFGSGYSSLGYLQQLPFDKLKIDRSFAVAVARSDNGGVIIQAIVTLGRALGMGIVVEGVETEEQRVLLRLAGCNEMQGFLFGRPAPRDVIARLLTGPGRVTRMAMAS